MFSSSQYSGKHFRIETAQDYRGDKAGGLGSTTNYKSKEIVTAAEKRENAIMEKRIVAVQKEVQESEAFSTIYQSLIYCLYA